MLTFLTSKVGAYLIAGVMLVLLVAGIVLEIRYLENRLENLATANAQLATANQALNKNIIALNQQQAQIIQEFTAARNADNQAYNNIQRTTNAVNTKAAQIARIRAKKPDLLINLLNKNLECERSHFLEQGRCVNGVWHV